MSMMEGLMEKRCVFCDAAMNPNKSYQEQGWVAVDLQWENSDGSKHSYFGRACPEHRKSLMDTVKRLYDGDDVVGR